MPVQDEIQTPLRARRFVPDLDADLSLPCPVRMPLELALEEWTERPVGLVMELGGHANRGEKEERNLSAAKSPDDLPPLLLTPGVGWLFGKASRERLMDSGAYADISGWKPSGALSALHDPQRHVTVVASNLTVLVVDDERAADRKPLHAWEDLLDPSWRRGVAFRGDGKTFCETTLLHLWKRFGMDAMPAFRAAIGGHGHPARIAKALGNGEAGFPPAATLPIFFARLLPRRPGLRIVWPREGAIASPVTLFVRRDAPERVKALGRWLCGPEAAAVFSRVGLPSARPDADWAIPEGRDLLWLGWDAIRGQDLSATLTELQELFRGAGN
jgi:ABC-type Fe3+ transport system substrate-binding protein